MLNITEFGSGKTDILIVDDDCDIRLTLCEFLQSRNFSVSSAANAAQAIALLESRKQPFDIICTDLMMPPGADGLEVLKTAKQLNPLSYVVIMTGCSSIQPAIESIRSGAFDYLTKPFKLAEMEIATNRVLEHLSVSNDNKRLAAELATANEKSATIEARLERIELLLSRIAANVPSLSKTLTPLDF
jgi:DNA-binding NtrC family response regulator